MPERKLTLRADRIGDLATDELRRIAGGSHTCPTVGITFAETCDGCRVPTMPARLCFSLDGWMCSDACTPVSGAVAGA